MEWPIKYDLYHVTTHKYIQILTSLHIHSKKNIALALPSGHEHPSTFSTYPTPGELIPDIGRQPFTVPLTPMCTSLDCKRKLEKACREEGEHANSTQEGPSWLLESNQNLLTSYLVHSTNCRAVLVMNSQTIVLRCMVRTNSTLARRRLLYPLLNSTNGLIVMFCRCHTWRWRCCIMCVVDWPFGLVATLLGE